MIKYNKPINYLSSRSSIGWAGSWSDLGCKFKSYFEQFIKGSDGIGRHE